MCVRQKTRSHTSSGGLEPTALRNIQFPSIGVSFYCTRDLLSLGLSFASLLVLELYIDEVSDPCVYGNVT